MICKRVDTTVRLFPTTRKYTDTFCPYELLKDTLVLSRKNLEEWEWTVVAPYELSRWKS